MVIKIVNKPCLAIARKFINNFSLLTWTRKAAGKAELANALDFRSLSGRPRASFMPLSHVKNARCCGPEHLHYSCAAFSLSISSPAAVQLERNHDKLIQERIESRRQVTTTRAVCGFLTTRARWWRCRLTRPSSAHLPAAASLKPFAL